MITSSSLILGLRRDILAALGCVALLTPACAGDDSGSSSESTGESTSEGTTDASTSAGSQSSTSEGSASITGGESMSEGTTGVTSEGSSSSATDSTGTTTESTTEGTVSTTDPTEGTTEGTSEGTTEGTSEGTSEGTTEGTGGESCDPPPSPPEGYDQDYACFKLPDGLSDCGECDEACVLSNVDAAITQDPDFCSAEGLLIQCGPDSEAPMGTCCFYAAYQGIICEGRPLIVDGELRAAAVCPRGDWLAPLPRPELAMDAATRSALGDAWAEDARMEHASIAAFAQLILHLMANGAPAELIAGAQRALADEVEHARLCFSLASAYRDEPQGPGDLAIDGAINGTPTLRELAVAAAVEGCVGETIAASIARVSAAAARDPSVRVALTQIADDESRHAAFSWRLVRWAIETGGDEVRDAVAVAFAQAIERPAQARPVAAGVNGEIWREHGRLTEEGESAVIRDSLREVVGPCAQALLGASPRTSTGASAGLRA